MEQDQKFSVQILNAFVQQSKISCVSVNGTRKEFPCKGRRAEWLSKESQTGGNLRRCGVTSGRRKEAGNASECVLE